MSVLYCAIPHFAAALARREGAAVEDRPLILVGPEQRVFAVSAQAAACGVVPGMPLSVAQVRCPEARLLEANIARCRSESEILLQLLEDTSPQVEPHGWGGAYVDLGDLARSRAAALRICQHVGRAVRQELGEALQPALGWDSSKFTAQAAARRTQPGRLRAIDAVQERSFLRPLPVTLLPLAAEALQRLRFLGLHTLGQYAALPSPAIWQQFGRPGKMAHRCARGEDDRPVVPRREGIRLEAEREFEGPLVVRERIVTALRYLVGPLLDRLRGNLQACGQVRLSVRLDNGDVQEQSRSFLLPVTEEDRVVGALEQLLDGMRWTSGAVYLAVALTEIQDVVMEQLSLFAVENEGQARLQEVQRYLVGRFGAHSLRRAVLSQPGAPLPEWRIGWQVSSDP
jgi:nucleotidyltransferase/DNA polymerase involved in DNA repair